MNGRGWQCWVPALLFLDLGVGYRGVFALKKKINIKSILLSLSSLFNGKGNRGLERLNNLPKVT